MNDSNLINKLEKLRTSPPDKKDLAQICAKLQKDISSGQCNELHMAGLDALGTLGKDPEWRAPLAEADALEYALGVLQNDAMNGDIDLQKLCYRLIANICADDDRGRSVLVNSWPVFLECFQTTIRQFFLEPSACQENDPSINNTAPVSSACAAMTNFLRAEEFSTDPCLEDLGSFVLSMLDVNSGERVTRKSGTDFMPEYYWDLLLLNLEDTPEETLKSMALDAARQILDAFDDLRGFPDDDAESWVAVLARLFAYEDVKDAFAKDQFRFIQLLRIFYALQDQYVHARSQELSRIWPSATAGLQDLAPVNGPHVENVEIRELFEVIVNVTTCESFTRSSMFFEESTYTQVEHWIQWTAPHPEGQNEHLQQCAMIIFGSFVDADNYTSLLQDTKMAGRLYDIANYAEQDQTRFLALSLLNHCFLKASTPAKTGALEKALRGLSIGLKDSINPMMAHISLTAARSMLTKRSVKDILEPVDLPDVVSIDESAMSYLQRALHRAHHSDQPLIKIAVGRFVAQLLRCVYTETDTEPAGKAMLAVLGQKVDLSEALEVMVTGAGLPQEDANRLLIQQEGWFSMALLARTREGAKMVVQTLGKPEVKAELASATAGADEHLRSNMLVTLSYIEANELEFEDIKEHMASLKLAHASTEAA